MNNHVATFSDHCLEEVTLLFLDLRRCRRRNVCVFFFLRRLFGCGVAFWRRRSFVTLTGLVTRRVGFVQLCRPNPFVGRFFATAALICLPLILPRA